LSANTTLILSREQGSAFAEAPMITRDMSTTTDPALAEGRGPTEVVSRYLEAIYYMDAEAEPVRSARLADWLGVSRPTVTVALRRMTRDGMVRLNGRKEIELTDRGREAAAAIVRRHRIMERWLTDALGLDWVTADEEAARLEHAVSDVVEHRLWETLGRPTSCPHGNPIPGYADVRDREVRLSTLSQGAAATISRISEVAEREAPTLLRYLLERRLVPGTRLDVLEVDPVGRTLRVRAADHEVTLSHETAAKIWVEPSPA
jgi:DtxR family transcriptional regulator, Mn-dependent transcriptional regulator